MVDDVLKYKRLDGVQSALRGLADAMFKGGRQAENLASDLAKLDLPGSATREQLLAAMEGHILGKAAYVGRFHAQP